MGIRPLLIKKFLNENCTIPLGIPLISCMTCKIWNILHPTYLPAPTEQIWNEAVEGFSKVWGFPNCLGSIDGKHIKVKCPSNSGSSYFCYKNFFSIVLLAVVDPFYKFMVVDIGSYGRHSDSAIFENSAFFQ